MSSASNVQARVSEIGGHQLPITQLSQYNGWAKHPRGNFLVPADYDVQSKYKVTVRQAPLTAFNGSSFLNGSTLEFKIDKSHVASTITHAYIQVKVTNSTGAGVTLAPTPFWIKRLEFIGAGGNPLASFDGTELFLMLNFLNRDEYEKSCSYFGLTDQYATTGSVIANGASVVQYIPVFALLASARLHLQGLQSDFSIRIETQSSSFTVLAGTHPTITDVALIIKGYQEPDSVRAARQLACRGNLPIKIPFINSIDYRTSATLAPSSTYSFVLNNIRANLVGMFFILRPVGFTGATQGNYLPIASFDLQLASGESVLGSYVRLHEDNKLDMAEMFNNRFSTYKDAYFISWSSDPAGDFASGSSHGQMALHGTERLQITTTSTLVAGDYQLDVFGLSHEHLHIEKCVLTVKK